MIDNPVIVWTLTAVLLLSGSYHVLRAARSEHLTVRANQSLHALMNVVMAAMVWNLVPSTMLAQIAVLAGAALWFVIQAVAHPEFKILCAGSQGRLKCVYHSLTMAGAALMVAIMTQPTAGKGETVAGDGTSMPPMPATHHAMAAAPHSPAMPAFVHSPALAVVSTTFFTIAAVIFLILLLSNRLRKETRRGAVPRASARTDHGLEALGAATMALMFATMSA